MNNGVTVVLLYIAFIVGLFFGWINNIVILYHTGLATLTGETILRVVGIFVAPLGVVMGYL